MRARFLFGRVELAGSTPATLTTTKERQVMIVNKFVNLTPHTINVVNSDDSIRTFEPSGQVARVSSSSEVVSCDDATGIEISKTTFGEVEGLPDFADQTLLIVSGLVLGAIENRPDVLAPGELVRNDQGQPIGCKGLRCK